MSQTLSRAIGVRRKNVFHGRTITGKSHEARSCKSAVKNKASLDELVAVRTGQIVPNSRSTVTAIKDLWYIAIRAEPG